MARSDIKPTSFEELSWSPDKYKASLTALFHHVNKHGEQVIAWYLTSKTSKGRCARWTRIGAIIALALSGIFPIISEMHVEDCKLLFHPGWASLSLALGAVLLAYDRFFGCSRAWMRFIATEHKIRTLLQEFQMDWEIQRAGWENPQPTKDEVQKTLSLYKGVLTRINTIIEEETSIWITDFQDAMKKLDDSLRAL